MRVLSTNEGFYYNESRGILGRTIYLAFNEDETEYTLISDVEAHKISEALRLGEATTAD